MKKRLRITLTILTQTWLLCPTIWHNHLQKHPLVIQDDAESVSQDLEEQYDQENLDQQNEEQS